MHTGLLSNDAATELNALLRGAIERRDVPGVVAQVANHERVLYRGACATLDEHETTAMPTDAIFRIASMTKPVTSVGIMMLREQGLLDLDDPLGRYLPEFTGREVMAAFDASQATYTTRPATREVTIRHLLAHTAGFGYGSFNHTLHALSKGATRPRDLPLLYDPGSRWTYGINTLFLGEVIEQVAGQPLDAFFESRIFRPLGMKDTGFNVKPENLSRLVALFRRTDGELVGEPRPESYEPRVSGDSGLVGTAGDYIRFLHLLLNGGQWDGTRLLTDRSVSEMTKNQIGSLAVVKQPSIMPAVSNPFPLGAGKDKFGLGFQLKEGAAENSRSPGSYSWAGLFNTHFWGDAQKDIAAVLLMQVLPFYDERCIRLLRDFERHIYKNLE
ncbi:MAG: class A beta-lactamase-related serine hydrolase [Chloroflexi bacterium]|nr:class A beta-lactamase-related serine hydrolase [Chloroflexota bacterium]